MGITVSEDNPALSERSPTRVLVVDDHRMFTELLAHLLSGYDDIELVGVATTADEALAFAAGDPPDVAVIDYRLPGEDGARVAARFKAAHPSVKLVMLTGFDDDEVLRSAITAGCSGFVTKDRAAEDLVRAVRAVRSGAPALDPDAVNRLVVAPAPERRGALRSLTSRELDVLELLVEGVSTRGIAERLFVSINTARNHVQRVLAKLGVHSRLEAVALATREGLVHRRDRDRFR
ncbi:MAG TPA: response regulator transcription factor [Acidimicrobiia bacterium]|nr:response regulator transcription factor [Acidimicrobiia bacterium]